MWARTLHDIYRTQLKAIHQRNCCNINNKYKDIYYIYINEAQTSYWRGRYILFLHLPAINYYMLELMFLLLVAFSSALEIFKHRLNLFYCIYLYLTLINDSNVYTAYITNLFLLALGSHFFFHDAQNNKETCKRKFKNNF